MGELKRGCEACGRDEFTSLYPVTDTNQNVAGTWHIEQCGNCGLGRLAPLPDRDQIASFYTAVFYNQKGQRFRPWMEYLRRQFAVFRCSTLLKMVPKAGSLVDFGAGAGHFGEVMKQRGWRVYSVDPYSSAADGNAICRPDGDGIILQLPSNSIDVITLWHVVEHLRNPGMVLTELRRVLRPGGILLLSQPDFSSLQARAFGPCWLILDPPRHLYQFTPQSLGSLARRLGFDEIKVEHGSLELGPYTIAQSMMNKLLGNKNYLFRFLKNPDLNQGKLEKIMVAASLLLGAIITPLVFLYYFAALLFKSGDVFTAYFKKNGE